MMFLVQVVEPPMMAFVFITAIGYFVPIPAGATTWIAIAIVVLWFILSNLNVGLTGSLANIFFFTMVILSIIVSCSLLFSGRTCILCMLVWIEIYINGEGWQQEEGASQRRQEKMKAFILF